jgi:hypothetical protein
MQSATNYRIQSDVYSETIDDMNTNLLQQTIRNIFGNNFEEPFLLNDNNHNNNNNEINDQNTCQDCCAKQNESNYQIESNSLQHDRISMSMMICNHWICGYDWRNLLLSDFLAGIAVGVMAVPQSMSYAKLAGLPVEYGLYSAFIPTFVYGLFGTSR